MESLVSTNREERRRAAVELDEQRKQLIAKLIAILNSTNAPEVKVHAVVVLGQYRAAEAVPILVQHFEWDDVLHGGFYNGFVKLEEMLEKDRPVSGALMNIGEPAVPALMEKIAQIDDAKVARKCVAICRRIEGLEVTQFRLQNNLNKETDQKKKERIQSAQETLKDLKDYE